MLTFANPLFGKNSEIDQLAPFLADLAEIEAPAHSYGESGADARDSG